MHDQPHSSHDPEPRVVRHGKKTGCVFDDLANPDLFQYSLDGELIRSDARPVDPRPTYTHPAPGLNDLLYRTLATALDPTQRKFLATEAMNLGCDVPHFIAEKISLAILAQHRLTRRRPAEHRE